jgi:hypothetical protein
LCFALLPAVRSGAQNVPGSIPHGSLGQPNGERVGAGLEDDSSSNPMDEEKILRALNTDRQKSMVSDTNKLLKLVNELNAEIGQTNPDSLTPSQLQKVAEIEKLAHNVRDKMSTSVRGAAPLRQPLVRMR